MNVRQLSASCLMVGWKVNKRNLRISEFPNVDMLYVNNNLINKKEVISLKEIN